MPLTNAEKYLNAVNLRMEIDRSGLNISDAFELAYVMLTPKALQKFEKVVYEVMRKKRVQDEKLDLMERTISGSSHSAP